MCWARLQSMIVPPSVSNSPPLFPRFTIRACMLGKSYSGKTTCLAKISNGRSWSFIIVSECASSRQNMNYLSSLAVCSSLESALGLYVLSANSLIQDALSAYQQEPQPAGERQKESQVRSISSEVKTQYFWISLCRVWLHCFLFNHFIVYTV